MSSAPLSIADIFEKRKVSSFQYLVVVLCGLVLFIDGFDTQAISYILPRLAKDWHIPAAVMGSIFSSTLVGLMAGYLFISPLSDKFGHRRVILIATFLFGLFTLLTVMARNVPELLALRFLTGVGLGAAAPGAIALTGEYSPQRLRATFVLAIYCGFSFGFVVAGFAAGELLTRFGWSSLLWVGGLFPLALSVLLYLMLPESLAFLARRKTDIEPLRAILRRIDPGLADQREIVLDHAQESGKRAAISSLFKNRSKAGTLLLWFVFFINLAVFYFMQSWLPSILSGFKYPMHTVVWLTSLSTIGGILAAFVVGPLMDRVGPYVTLGVLYLFGALFMAFTAGALSSQLWVLTIAVFLGGFCVSGGQKSAIALAAIFYPVEFRSTGVGWALGIGRLGGIAGPALAGLLLGQHWVPGTLFYGSGVMMLFAGLAVLGMGYLYGARTKKALA